MSLPLPHPDELTGLMARVLQALTRSSRNTLADLDVYRGLPIDTVFPAPQRIPEARVTTRWRLPGIVSEDIVFTSLHQPLEARFAARYREKYGSVDIVYARRVRPSAARSRPRLLYLHGYMQPETYLEELFLLVAMAQLLDMEIIQLQPPYHGRRTPARALYGGELYWTADLVRSIEALRQTLLDARTLLGWLLAEDPRPVGISGISLGGALSAALTCLDARFAFSAPLIAHMDLAAMLEDAPVLETMRRELASFGWGIDDFRRFVGDIGWYDLAPVVPVERIHLFAASEDLFFDPKLVEQMRRAWGSPQIRWYPCSHMGFIPRLPLVLGEIRRFTDRLPDCA